MPRLGGFSQRHASHGFCKPKVGSSILSTGTSKNNDLESVLTNLKSIFSVGVTAGVTKNAPAHAARMALLSAASDFKKRRPQSGELGPSCWA